MNIFSTTRIAGILAVVCCSTVLCAQPSNSPDCQELRSRFDATVNAVKSSPAALQYSAYLKLLTSVSDDPADCVSSDIETAIRHAEQQLILLKIGDKTFAPEWIFHCGEIDARTLHCTGPEADDTMLNGAVLGGEATLKDSVGILPNSGLAQLNVSESLAADVVGIYVIDRSYSRDGEPPVRIPIHGLSIPLSKLHTMKSSVVIVVFRCKDPLHFRKCVWFFHAANS
jgi:hypothetical protein